MITSIQAVINQTAQLLRSEAKKRFRKAAPDASLVHKIEGVAKLLRSEVHKNPLNGKE